MKKNYFALLMLLLVGNNMLHAQDGTLDPSFNGDGIVDTKVNGLLTGFYRVKLQPDGKILVFGTMQDTFGYPLAVVGRYNTDGSEDPSFANNGFYVSQSGDYLDGASGLLLPDGKILLLSDVLFSNYIALTRLLTNGAPDSTFGIFGTQIIELDTDMDSPNPNEIMLLPDGKIVVAGSYVVFTGNIEQSFAARLLPNGVLDDSFGNNGIVKLTTPNNAVNLNIKKCKLQPDGKIVLSGDIGNTQLEDQWYIARLMPDGAFDPSFDSDGFVTPNIGNTSWEGAYEIIILPDNKIIVAGFGQKLPGWHFTIMRFFPDGAIDNTFGLGGKAQVAFECCFSGIFDIVQQADNKLLACGFSKDNSDHHHFSLARFKPNGIIDQTFGDAGKLIIPFNHDSLSARATSIALQTDGKILVGGWSDVQNGLIQTGLLVRLNPDNPVGISPIETLSDHLLEVHPNPFSGHSLQISFDLKETSEVSLSLFDLLGRKVFDLISAEERAEGNNMAFFNLPQGIPVGEYFVRLESKSGSQTAKIIKIE